ncbi:TRAP transporter small permease [Thalassospira lucentensis]|uniref:TRAP transporter small permease protein n=1 Tax=Thalassospira lucentensis TaxID=168935 RepID=A0A358HNX7_9PROT|nr:TRAP transporter small permease subunit [Thalassospira lucentensis]HBU96871.1 C4-dicarboxylate ABC transporter permease [Thalassospira lucentensis]HCW66972.1 C4-dicarboxylate ABC transporter permease [Thalassospira lucentensis]|tara:strand:+ start:1936 stop:2487 length:552 start_codon:yes stop_codon:yes gene_type:complete
MTKKIRQIGQWLHRRAENIAALMLAVMFGAFIVQVACRYLLNFPIGGASELTIIMWLWIVLWGAAFVLREDDEIRFDIVYSAVPRKVRRVMTILAALALLLLYGVSLPATWDFVTFMKIQDTSYLDIRFDWLFSIYVIFAVAILIRYTWILIAALRGKDAFPTGTLHENAPDPLDHSDTDTRP